MNNILKIKTELCTGCSACYNICPVGAISMNENSEGFKEPVIDKEKCTNCGLCAKCCPVLNIKYENNKKPECYAFMASDDIRMNSSSGGAFPVLAYEFLNNGGYVAGAVWTEDMRVKHIVSDKIEDIERMRGSKYLQSDMNDCYKQIKSILDEDKKVLFTGTPCQVAGLKLFLRKDYENLYCVDLICHGVPSPKVFKKYLKENFNDEKIYDINFRSKQKFGWTCGLGITTNESDYKITTNESDYYDAFLKGIIFRKSCYTCRFNKLPRQADITIGDFWGINKVSKKLNDNMGTSVILKNNKKGSFLISILKQNSKLLKKIHLKYALKENQNIYKSSDYKKERDEFYSRLDTMSIKENKNIALDDVCDVMFINLWFSANYGAVLSCYGVQCLFDKLGLRSKVINFTPNFSNQLSYKNSFSEEFGRKYLNLTNSVKTYDDFHKLNKYCSTFVAGSDQIWNYNTMTSHHGQVTKGVYLLDFVKPLAKKITYAPSFGSGFYEQDYLHKEMFRHYLHQFNSISVREFEGKNILKNYFDVDSEQLIDGAFHIPKEKLEELTEPYKTDEKYIAYYTLPHIQHYKSQLEQAKVISDKLGVPLKVFEYNQKTSVEKWLAFIKNSQFVISNSYHSMVFAIIFNIPFVQIISAKSQCRFETLYKILGITDNSIYPTTPVNKLDFEKIFVNRNWESINSKIQEEVKKAENWMEKAYYQENKRKLYVDNYNMIHNLMFEDRLAIISNKNKIRFNYIKYKLLSKLLKGKKKFYYTNKRNKYKEYLNIIKNLKKRI